MSSLLSSYGIAGFIVLLLGLHANIITTEIIINDPDCVITIPCPPEPEPVTSIPEELVTENETATTSPSEPMIDFFLEIPTRSSRTPSTLEPTVFIGLPKQSVIPQSEMESPTATRIGNASSVAIVAGAVAATGGVASLIVSVVRPDWLTQFIAWLRR